LSSGKPVFSSRVVAWQKLHGRHDLPWQNTRDPYRVWLSEVMLQQTQVATVIGYFDRFVARFPDVRALAAAQLDEVMGLWSGLGYYSRARNLHQCACAVVEQWGGTFPERAEDLVALPGIGRSTAAAITSLCFGERVAIMDANVRRVLTRYLAFDGDLAQQANQNLLWEQACGLLPRAKLAQTMPTYTQGMMDLGATVCLPRQPLCGACPVKEDCGALQLGSPQGFPVRTRKLKRGARSVWLLWARNRADAVWLQRRPVPGVWAGLYCLPWFDSREALVEQVPARYHSALQDIVAIKHVLTHMDLHLHPVQVDLPADTAASPAGQWFEADQWPQLGLPAPVRVMLQA
jgi:A/G-specific adenine glycosylase